MAADEKGSQIRRGELRDTAVLAGFNIAMAAETESLELLPEVISAGVAAILADPGRGCYLLAEFGGEVAGALMVTSEWSDWRNGFFWWIQSVYVRPEFRRQGIYRSLHEHLRQLAKTEPNVCGLRLYVERENERAQATYSRLGMRETHYLLYEELKQGLRFRQGD
ncbi:MAG: GNAT family N-acetyltransferase [Planctomycetota bacterium]